MKTVLLVFGTRPEAIKMAPLVLEFKKKVDQYCTLVCVTGQHREMLDQVLRIFDITPDFDLEIMRKGQDLYDITSRVLMGLRDVFNKVKPDLVLVHGDTSTSTAAALAAFYQRIEVAHVEAGLRTYNIYNPWPEEMNRQLTSRIASLHFAPTTLSRENLLSEGIDDKKIFVTGNTVIDALYYVINKLNSDETQKQTIIDSIASSGFDLMDNSTRKIVLITGHRRENFGDGFLSICQSIKYLAEKYPEVNFIYPMHLNPNVRKPIREIFGSNDFDNIYFIEPLEYLQFVFLMGKSYLILTDSGGIQEEAPGLKKPVLVMRETTERPEALSAGTVRLVGTDFNKIVEEVSLLLDDEDQYKKLTNAVNPYGDGTSAKKILKALDSL